MLRVSHSIIWLASTLFLFGCAESEPTPSSMVSGLRLNTILGGEQAESFAKAERIRTFEFPRDHGAHPNYRSEWWYITAVLQDADGHDYGVQFTLFRQALSPSPTGTGPWHTGAAFLGHLAVTDVAAGVHREAQRFSRGHPALANVVSAPMFKAHIEDWVIVEQDKEGFVLQLDAAEIGQFSVTLNLQQTRPILLQGDQGWSRKGPDSASYYYSMPRLAVQGELSRGDEVVEVNGLAWLDREWSTSVLSEGVEGWDWFALQLDDGRNVMAFRLRRSDGQRDPFDHGILVEQESPAQQNTGQKARTGAVLTGGDAGVMALHVDNFSLQPQRFWIDENGIEWPVAWMLEIEDEQYKIEAMLNDQVMNTAITYWEGIVAVTNVNGQRIGRGYMELTGYQGRKNDTTQR